MAEVKVKKPTWQWEIQPAYDKHGRECINVVFDQVDSDKPFPATYTFTVFIPGGDGTSYISLSKALQTNTDFTTVIEYLENELKAWQIDLGINTEEFTKQFIQKANTCLDPQLQLVEHKEDKATNATTCVALRLYKIHELDITQRMGTGQPQVCFNFHLTTTSQIKETFPLCYGVLDTTTKKFLPLSAFDFPNPAAMQTRLITTRKQREAAIAAATQTVTSKHYLALCRAAASLNKPEYWSSSEIDIFYWDQVQHLLAQKTPYDASKKAIDATYTDICADLGTLQSATHYLRLTSPEARKKLTADLAAELAELQKDSKASAELCRDIQQGLDYLRGIEYRLANTQIPTLAHIQDAELRPELTMAFMQAILKELVQQLTPNEPSAEEQKTILTVLQFVEGNLPRKLREAINLQVLLQAPVLCTRPMARTVTSEEQQLASANQFIDSAVLEPRQALGWSANAEEQLDAALHSLNRKLEQATKEKKADTIKYLTQLKLNILEAQARAATLVGDIVTCYPRYLAAYQLGSECRPPNWENFAPLIEQQIINLYAKYLHKMEQETIKLTRLKSEAKDFHAILTLSNTIATMHFNIIAAMQVVAKIKNHLQSITEEAEKKGLKVDSDTFLSEETKLPQGNIAEELQAIMGLLEAEKKYFLPLSELVVQHLHPVPKKHLVTTIGAMMEVSLRMLGQTQEQRDLEARIHIQETMFAAYSQIRTFTIEHGLNDITAELDKLAANYLKRMLDYINELESQDEKTPDNKKYEKVCNAIRRAVEAIWMVHYQQIHNDEDKMADYGETLLQVSLHTIKGVLSPPASVAASSSSRHKAITFDAANFRELEKTAHTALKTLHTLIRNPKAPASRLAQS